MPIGAAIIASQAMVAIAVDNKGNAIVERIETESEGNVTIDMPESVINMLIHQVAVQHKGPKGVVLKSGVNKLNGWRVQVFSESTNPNSLEARAKARGSAVAARFSKYRGQVYAYPKGPTWYTQIGNFMSAAEANAALAELKRAFPKYAGEMRVVKCKITVIK